jgi:hypothetical protein
MNFSMQPLVSGAAGRHLSGDRGPTVREAVEAFIAGINDGSLRDRSGRVNKPSARRGYERELRARVVVAFGGSRRRSSSAMMRTPLIAASSLRARDWI